VQTHFEGKPRRFKTALAWQGKLPTQPAIALHKRSLLAKVRGNLGSTFGQEIWARIAKNVGESVKKVLRRQGYRHVLVAGLQIFDAVFEPEHRRDQPAEDGKRRWAAQ
jgi:hypothetical protein